LPVVEPMPDLVIDGLEPHVVHTLKWRAERSGRSLEEEVRRVLVEAARLTVEGKLAMVDEIRNGMPPQSTDSADLLREDRDR
jgi:plasmid stability protein